MHPGIKADIQKYEREQNDLRQAKRIIESGKYEILYGKDEHGFPSLEIKIENKWYITTKRNLSDALRTDEQYADQTKYEMYQKIRKITIEDTYGLNTEKIFVTHEMKEEAKKEAIEAWRKSGPLMAYSGKMLFHKKKII